MTPYQLRNCLMADKSPPTASSTCNSLLTAAPCGRDTLAMANQPIKTNATIITAKILWGRPN